MKEVKIFQWNLYATVFFLSTVSIGFLFDIYKEGATGLRLYFLLIMVIASIVGIVYAIKKSNDYYFKYDNSKVKWLFPYMDTPKVLDIQHISQVGGIGHIINVQKQDGSKVLFSVEHVDETAQKKIRQFFQSRVR